MNPPAPSLPSRHRETRGLLLALLWAVCSAVFIVPYKVAVDAGHGAGLVFVLLLAAACLNTGASVGLARQRIPTSRYALGVALLMSLFTVVGNWSSMQTIAELHPAVVTALLQTQVLYVALVSYAVLKERVGLSYWIGASFALGGVYVLRVPSGAALGVSFAGLAFANLAAFCFGMLHVATRKSISRIDPVSLNAIRLWLSVLALAALPAVRNDLWNLSGQQLWLTLLAALLGPFLARVALMYSAHYIAASRAILLSPATPVFALLFSWMFLGTLPSTAELLGSGLVLMGIFLPLLHRGAVSNAR